VPATTQQSRRCTAFYAPAFDLTVTGSVDVDPRVRVNPLKLHYLAFEAQRLVAVKLGCERVVSDGSAGCAHSDYSADYGCQRFLLHGQLLLNSNVRVVIVT